MSVRRGGLRIFYPPPNVTAAPQQPIPRDAESGGTAASLPVASALVQDEEWKARFREVTGDMDAGRPPEEREGTLWELYRELRAAGLRVDARGFGGAFRVDCSPEEAARLADLAPPDALLRRGLATAMNLGKYDFFPRVAGKGGAARYLQERWGLAKDECLALFDDDNDLESVRRRAAAEPAWVVARAAGTGVFATEELLDGLLAQVRARHVPPGSAPPSAAPALARL